MSDQRQRGLDRMTQVYGWEFQDGPGDFFGLTADHLFAEIWNRDGLTDRDRRLLLIGMLAATRNTGVADIQMSAALANGELTAEQLREIVIFIAHYAGWPVGAELNTTVEGIIGKHERSTS